MSHENKTHLDILLTHLSKVQSDLKQKKRRHFMAQVFIVCIHVPIQGMLRTPKKPFLNARMLLKIEPQSAKF